MSYELYYWPSIQGRGEFVRLALEEAGRLWVNQLQLSVTDFVAEVHDTHHPIAASLYYKDQSKEARRRTSDFLQHRVPKFFDYFERVLARNPRGDRYMVGAKLTYLDLSVFQLIAGMHYAFPIAMKKVARAHPRLQALHARVQERPRIAAYLASPRRLAFNEDGIFRHYPELDLK